MTRDEGTGTVTRNIKRISGPNLANTDTGDISEPRFSGTPSFLHCESIYQTPSQIAFTSNNAYDPSSRRSATGKSVALRPTAAATANYYDLLDALIAAAFDHKRSPGSAEAYGILVDMITPPDFEEKTSCAECFEKFSMTNFRHHCRNCGRSICRPCSSVKNKRIPKYGYTDPVRVSETRCLKVCMITSPPLPCLALPGLALPDLVLSCLALQWRLVLDSLALHSLAFPCLPLPVFALPCLA